MRKISILLITLLIITSILPTGVFADSTEVVKDSVEPETTEGASLDQELTENLYGDDEEVSKETEESPDTSADRRDESTDNLNEGEEEPDNSQTATEGNIGEDGETSNVEQIDESNITGSEEGNGNDEKVEAENPNDPVSDEKSEEVTTEELSISLNNTLPEIVYEETSMLGHLSSGADIYKTIGDEPLSNSDEYLNAVYYIKQLAIYGEQTYYLLSTEPSADEGRVGWAKKEDLTDSSPRNHVTVDKKDKTFIIRGNGSAYSKAWGGPKDIVFRDMSKYKGQKFEIHLTEKVDNTTWYRGKLDEKTVWLTSSQVMPPVEIDPGETSKTSKLGHLRSGSTIYKILGDDSSSFKSDDYLNTVYYIKKQADYNNQTYYLISLEPSSEKGVKGWVKAKDMSTHSHIGVDKDPKAFIINGKGNAYSKAWGGSKDLVYDLANYKNQIFNIHLTEKVGSNTWYRGNLDGETVWIHSSYVTAPNESKTSKLGHLRSGAYIYETIGDESSSISSEDYLNVVYYIKKQAELNGQTYYLISQKPSSKNGVIGWVKREEMSTHQHIGVDKYSKRYYLIGEGNAYSKAWGGSKDLVYDLSEHRNEEFDVHLTEKVGKNVWYRGKLNGKTVWVHNSYVMTNKPEKTSRLGHIRSSKVKIYNTLTNMSEYKVAGDKYTDAVYYIKVESTVKGQKYYLISKEPSDNKDVVGWVSAEDLSTHKHVGKDKDLKTLYFTGKGKAYSKAWGGKKDLVFDNMSKYQAQKFHVHLTEKVGNNTWYRGDFDGEIIWLHESYVTTLEEKKTSKLGHLRSGATIYKTIGDDSSTFSSTDYLNAVYYIKKQAKFNDQTYYLISKEPSSTKGVVGWVKANEMSTHSHVGLDKNNKILYFTGEGKAYYKAWGGKKDLTFEDMSGYGGHQFHIHLTEKVGNNIWYRGDFEGERIWLNESYLTTLEEKETSKLGHLRSGATIYKTIGDDSSSFSSDNYLDAVYYIKKQAKFNDQTYYLISKTPSSTKGVVGWVQAEDLSTHPHVGVDKKSKVLYLTGKGKAYSKAWGGSEDLVYRDMTIYTGDKFNVNLTEKVGNNTWYRGNFKGKTIWLHESYVSEQKKSFYNLTLNEALVIQLTATPQTTNNYDTFVSKQYINNKNEVTADVLNVRGGPSTNYWVVGQLTEGDKVTILGEKSGWYQIEYTKNHQFVNAKPEDVLYYLDPNNFINHEKQKFQFLDLSRNSGASKKVLNNYLKGKGTLDGQGQAFIDAGIQHGINDVYLISHAILETGHGTSKLAQGVKYNGKTVYNMYGVGAYDNCPVDCGAKKAYEEGWTTPYKAIVGGAAFIGNDYIKAGQNTLYKMRWDPAAMESTSKFGKQYATDIGWAYKQVGTMYDLYRKLESYKLYLDIPVYK